MKKWKNCQTQVEIVFKNSSANALQTSDATFHCRISWTRNTVGFNSEETR